jgi:hypothetical protein
MLKEQQEEAVVAMDEADLFTRMLVDRSAERAHQDLMYVGAVHTKEEAALDQLDSELDELKFHATASSSPRVYSGASEHDNYKPLSIGDPLEVHSNSDLRNYVDESRTEPDATMHFTDGI